MVLPGLDTIGRPRRRQLEQEKRAPIREAAAGKTQETSSTQSNPDLPLRSARRFLKPDTVGYDEYAATFVAAAANPLWNRSSGCLSNGSVGSNESAWHCDICTVHAKSSGVSTGAMSGMRLTITLELHTQSGIALHGVAVAEVAQARIHRCFAKE